MPKPTDAELIAFGIEWEYLIQVEPFRQPKHWAFDDQMGQYRFLEGAENPTLDDEAREFLTRRYAERDE